MRKIMEFLKTRKFFVILIVVAFILPSLISATTYIAKGGLKITSEEYYEGENFDYDPDTLKITEIKKLFKVAGLSTVDNYQGGAFYHNYYFLCANNLESILIYDMSKYRFIAIIDTDEYTNTSYHCNSIAFGRDFYDKNDKFPLLYISMENADIHATLVFRITRIARNFSLEKIQKIIFEKSDVNNLFLPNSYIDQQNGYLYYAAYTDVTSPHYQKSLDNTIKFFKYEIPDFKISEVQLKSEEALETFEVDSETATQGACIVNGYLYQTFAFTDEPIIRIVNLKSHQIVYEDKLGPYGYYDEYENIAFYNNRFFAFGIKRLSMYEFYYSADLIN